MRRRNSGDTLTIRTRHGRATATLNGKPIRGPEDLDTSVKLPSANRSNGPSADAAAALAALPPPPSANGSNGAAGGGRDEGTGRFAKGNRGGPGNPPFGRRVAALRKAFLEAAAPERMRQLAEALLAKALAGDTAAAKLFLEYSLGRPAEARDTDRVDWEEFRLLKESPDVRKVFLEAENVVSPDYASGILAGWAAANPARIAGILDRPAGDRAPAGRERVSAP
jgi:hypothetical protein